MGLRVDGEAMYRALDAKVFELSIVVGIVCVKYRDETAVTGYIDPLPGPRSNLITSGPSGRGRGTQSTRAYQVEHRHELVALASQKCAMVVRVKGHSVVPFASANWIPADDLIGGGINHSENVLVLRG